MGATLDKRQEADIYLVAPANGNFEPHLSFQLCS